MRAQCRTQGVHRARVFSTHRPTVQRLTAWKILLCFLYFGIFSSACGARQNASKDTEETKKFSQVFEMDEVVIRASADDDIFDDHEAVDLRSTFDEASAYFQAEDYTNAITLYRRVLNASDETNWQKAASYNIALAYEHQHRWTDAQEAFEEVIRHFPTTEEGRDAHFRLAEVLAQIGEFQRIVPLMDRALQRPDISDERRIEGLIRKGTAMVELRAFPDAEKTLNNAIDFEERARQRALNEGRRYDPSRLVRTGIAQAKYLIGRIYHELFSEIRMVLPVERYKKDLADKDALFHQALKEYTRAVRTGDSYWAPQAGFQIAQLYEDYYFDILASEVPQHFTQEHRDIYFEELRKFLAPGLKSALQMYERALGMAYRMGSQEEVVEDLLEHLLALENYADSKEGWEAEHDAVFEGTHPRSPNPLKHMVFRDEVRGAP